MTDTEGFGTDEPSEAERAEALEQFLAAGGRWPGITDELLADRRAEMEADYTDDEPTEAPRP